MKLAVVIPRGKSHNFSMIEAEVRVMLVGSDLSASTKEAYERFACRFFTWFFDNYQDLDVSQVDASIVMTWLGDNPTWTPSTRYSAVASLKKFYVWKYGPDHPITRLKIRRIDPGPQRTLDSDELLSVLASVDTTTIGGVRDLAILSIMVDTGVRANEVCSLELDRLDLERQRFYVKVKGGSWAEKLFFDHTALYLRNWLVLRDRAALKGVKHVFVSIGGKKPGSKLTVSGLRYLSTKIATLAGTRRFSPHSLRRTFATLATENGAPTRVVQVAGGWKSIRMVERYTQTLKPDAIKPYSPIDKLME